MASFDFILSLLRENLSGHIDPTLLRYIYHNLDDWKYTCEPMKFSQIIKMVEKLIPHLTNNHQDNYRAIFKALSFYTPRHLAYLYDVDHLIDVLWIKSKMHLREFIEQLIEEKLNYFIPLADAIEIYKDCCRITKENVNLFLFLYDIIGLGNAKILTYSLELDSFYFNIDPFILKDFIIDFEKTVLDLDLK